MFMREGFNVSNVNRDLECPYGPFWTVRPGDTLFSIARATGVPLSEILSLNPAVDPNNLIPGQKICLPESAALPTGPIPPCPSGLYWVIAPGDTLYGIARAVGTTVDKLMELNPGIDPLNLQIGSSICLPEPSSQ